MKYKFELDGETYVIPSVTKEEAEEFDFNTPGDWRVYLKKNSGNIYVERNGKRWIFN